MTDGVFNVLFLCTGNSVRSIIAVGMLAAISIARWLWTAEVR